MVQNVATRNPSTLDELKKTVEELPATMDEAQVHRADENLLHRVLLCDKNTGGHFEAEM